jgi:hypothetical protein
MVYLAVSAMVVSGFYAGLELTCFDKRIVPCKFTGNDASFVIVSQNLDISGMVS